MLISEALRQGGEYRALSADIAAALGARSLPFAAVGLCDGASDALLVALLEDLKAKKKGTALVLLSEEKECLRLQRMLGAFGLRAAFYTARDLTFYNITASHEYEYERLKVLWGLLGGDFDVVLTTPMPPLATPWQESACRRQRSRLTATRLPLRCSPVCS